MENAVAANVLGTTGAICWSIQLIPQIIVNYRRHHTTGLQPTMMLLWATAGIPLGVYNITQNFNVALQIQPQLLTFLSLVTWAQCKYYRDGDEDDIKRWSMTKCWLVVVGIGLAMGAIEVALVFALFQAVQRHLEWPSILMAVLAALLLCAGVSRHYWDIYKERTVRGISFLFVGIDALGDLTSLVSLFFQPRLDILGMIIYASELALWLGVFACGGWYNFRPWVKEMKQRWMQTRSGKPGSPEIAQDETVAVEMFDNVNNDEEDHRSISSKPSSTVFQTASGARPSVSAEAHNTSVVRQRIVPV